MDLVARPEDEKMIITIDNIKTGLKWWREGNWPQDIHNSDYYEIYGIRAAGPTEKWWTSTVERLGQWHAYRSRKPPNTKVEIHSRGLGCLNELQVQYAQIIASTGTEPSIVNLPWESVSAVFKTASNIKPYSPVFASKMCHFLFPKLFIIMDNLATSVFDYEFYWRGMKDEWNRFKEKSKARSLLEKAINSDKPMHPLYPFETRIIEFSHIGYKHR